MSDVYYCYARALELEGRHPHDAGQWGITNMRLTYLEGVPEELNYCKVSVNADRTFQPTPPALHTAFRSGRSYFYRRVYDVDELANLIHRGHYNRLTNAALPIYSSWVSPNSGIITMPNSGELPAYDTHAIKLYGAIRLGGVAVEGEEDAHHFEFVNSWGNSWGNHGCGLLPFAYYSRYAFEQWIQYCERDLVGFRHKWIDGNLGAWQAWDEFDRRIYGFQVGDPDAERIGWAFAIETDGAIEVEELYVAHAHRRTGVATRLAERVAALAKAKGLPLRVWVSFADVASESPTTVAALPRLAKRMGVEFQSSPVRWAGYYATNETPGSPTPVEPDRVPGRPKSTLGALAAFAAMATSSPELAVKQAPTGFTVPMNGFHSGVESWDEQNGRRIELIHKKWQGGGLDADESAELARLQAVARTVVAAALPPPLLGRVDWSCELW